MKKVIFMVLALISFNVMARCEDDFQAMKEAAANVVAEVALPGEAFRDRAEFTKVNLVRLHPSTTGIENFSDPETLTMYISCGSEENINSFRIATELGRLIAFVGHPIYRHAAIERTDPKKRGTVIPTVLQEETLANHYAAKIYQHMQIDPTIAVSIFDANCKVGDKYSCKQSVDWKSVFDKNNI